MTWEIALAIARFFLAVAGIITTVAIAGNYYYERNKREQLMFNPRSNLTREYIIVIPKLFTKDDLRTSSILKYHINNGCIFILEHEYMTFLKYFNSDYKPTPEDIDTFAVRGYLVGDDWDYHGVNIKYIDAIGVSEIYNADVMNYIRKGPHNQPLRKITSRPICTEDPIYPLITHGSKVAARIGMNALIYFNNMTCGKIVEVERREDDE